MQGSGHCDLEPLAPKRAAKGLFLVGQFCWLKNVKCETEGTLMKKKEHWVHMNLLCATSSNTGGISKNLEPENFGELFFFFDLVKKISGFLSRSPEILVKSSRRREVFFLLCVCVQFFICTGKFGGMF